MTPEMKLVKLYLSEYGKITQEEYDVLTESTSLAAIKVFRQNADLINQSYNRCIMAFKNRNKYTFDDAFGDCMRACDRTIQQLNYIDENTLINILSPMLMLNGKYNTLGNIGTVAKAAAGIAGTTIYQNPFSGPSSYMSAKGGGNATKAMLIARLDSIKKNCYQMKDQLG